MKALRRWLGGAVPDFRPDVISMRVNHRHAFQEAATALGFAAVALLGFAIDASVLKLGAVFGLSPAVARVISLFCAMQATFTVNGLFVFHCLERRTLVRHWLGYMATNGFGNFCNYWIFVTLISLHWRVVSSSLPALAVSSSCAWVLNYLGTRLLVFGGAHKGDKMRTNSGAGMKDDPGAKSSETGSPAQPPPVT